MDTINEVPPGTVVVGYDGSEHSEAALRWAADEADLEGRALTIVTVTQPLSGWELSALSGGWTPPYEVQDAIRKHARDELARLQAALRHSLPDLQVDTLHQEGDARQVLLDLSEDAASMFLGTRGRGPVESLLLGSVSVALARGARCPVFVIRPPVPGQHRRGVLVGTDCGELTRATVEYAYRQAALRDLPLTVLYCVSGPDEAGGSVLDDTAPGYDEERRMLAEAVAGMAEKFPEVNVHLRIGQGRPEVCLVRESEHMDLVVVGHHRGKGFGDLIHLGSLVAPVVENARCPVAISVDRAATADRPTLP